MKPKFQNIQERLRGPVFSIVTPFRPDSEEIDYESLERYIIFAYGKGARNFYVMGYNSRYSQLSWEEIKLLNAFVAKKVKAIDANCVVIVADPLHCSAKVSVDFANHALDMGADVISLIVRERFYSEEQIVSHYKYISERTQIGMLIHEMPFLNGFGGPLVNWPISLLDKIADLENVMAIKEDAKDDSYSREVIAKIKDRLSIIISGGGKGQWLRFADMGCQAWLNGIGVYEPALAVNFWKHYQAHEMDYVKEFITQIEEPFFAKVVKPHSWHLGIKAALESRGLMSRKERLPMKELCEADYLDVKQAMESLPIQNFI